MKTLFVSIALMSAVAFAPNNVKEAHKQASEKVRVANVDYGILDCYQTGGNSGVVFKVGSYINRCSTLKVEMFGPNNFYAQRFYPTGTDQNGFVYEALSTFPGFSNGNYTFYGRGNNNEYLGQQTLSLTN